MLEDKERMKLLLRGRMSFTVYGPRSSGKTYRMHELFKEVGVPYIEINGIFVSRKMNFFKILTLQLRKYLGLDFDQQSFPSNLEAWTREMTQLVSEGKELIGLLDKLYIFIDDMEEITIDDSFISAFYDCCRLDLPFQFRFVFCGINYSDKAYQFKQPFRSLPTFCIPKPEELF